MCTAARHSKRYCVWLRSLLFAVALALLPSVAEAGEDYYKILGVSKKATEKQLKRAYKKQAWKWHPDKHQKDKDKATAKFQAIVEAYETLSNPEKRRLYDLGGEAAAKGQPPPQQGGPREGGGRPDAQGAHGARAGQWFHKQGQSARDSAGPEVDPRVFSEVFARMFAGQGMTPGAKSHQQARPPPPPRKQGGPLFGDAAGPVRELAFQSHAARIEAMRRQGQGLAVVLFYASGGRSCPTACHRIQKYYERFAEARGSKAAIAAVQCKRRSGMCAEFADHLPAVVLFGRGGRQVVLSQGEAASTSLLQRRLDQEAAKLQGLQELFPEDLRQGGEPCGGQFCLLLLERGPPQRAQAVRNALAAAAELLRREPVTVYYVKAEKHPDFVKPFEATSASAVSGSLRRLPAARLVLYRPRRQRFEVFEGNVGSAPDVADFAARAINRGTPLAHEMKKQF